MTYFATLPTDLFPLLFLYFSPPELIHILPQAERLSVFKSLFNSSIFWKTLWKRDVSSFVEASNTYQEYMNLFEKENYDSYLVALNWPKSDTNTWRIRPLIDYLTLHGYDILLYPILHNIYDCNAVISEAAYYGHIYIINKMIEKGVTYFDYAARSAIEGGHIDLFYFLFNKIPEKPNCQYYNKIMATAAEHGYKQIVELMLSKGASDYEYTMTMATYNNHIELVNLMLNLGANNYNKTLVISACRGHIDIVKLMLDLGANNYQEAIDDATQMGFNDIIELIKSYM